MRPYRIQWRAAVETLLSTVPVETPDFHAAADFCAMPGLGLRGPDALHLAIVRRLGLALATFDTTMADAARALAIPLVTIGAPL